MVERIVVCLCLAGITLLAVAAPAISQRVAAGGGVACHDLPPCGKPVADLIAALDVRVQERFHRADVSLLGAARIPTFGHGRLTRRFYPSGDEERGIVCGLREHQADAALFVAGRSVLGMPPGGGARGGSRGKETLAESPALHALELRRSRILSLGIEVSAVDDDAVWDRLPDADRLVRVARAVFQKGDVSEQVGEWTVAGKRVVASSQRCIECHEGRTKSYAAPRLYAGLPPLKVGDTIGAVLYAFVMRTGGGRRDTGNGGGHRDAGGGNRGGRY